MIITIIMIAIVGQIRYRSFDSIGRVQCSDLIVTTCSHQIWAPIDDRVLSAPVDTLMKR